MKRLLLIIPTLMLCGCAALPFGASRKTAPIRMGASVSGGSEVGSFPNASALTGSERILADQNATTVNLTPSQIATFLGITTTNAYGVEYNDDGTLSALLPSATGIYCFDWTSLTSPPALTNSCGSGSGNVSTSGTIAQYGLPYWATTTSLASLLPSTAGIYCFDWTSVTAAPTLTGSCGSASMVYPGAGIPLSTGTGWGTSYSSSNPIPAADLTLTGYAQLGIAQTFTALQTFGTDISIGGTTPTGSTGTGNLMFSNAPIFTPPAYATASVPTCSASNEGQPIYLTDGAGAIAHCLWNGTTGVWASNGTTPFTMAGSSGCTPTAATGDATGGSFTLASGCNTGTATVTITFNGAVGMTAQHMWVCTVNDQTLQAAGTWFGSWGQSSSTTTTATIPIPPAAGSTDVITFACSPQ